MEEKKNKCPLCSKRLVMKDGVPTCPDCGYRDPHRSGSSQSQAEYNRQFQSDYGQQTQWNYGQQTQSDYGRQIPSDYGQQPQAEKKPLNPIVIAIIVLVTGIAVASILAVIVGLFLSTVYSGQGNGTGEDSYREFSTTPPSSDYPESSVPTSTQHGGSSISHLTFEPPESELLQEFVSQVFDKPAASVTREDLNSVIRVEIHDLYYYNGTEIDYELSDGTAGTCYVTSGYVDSSDFKCFPNIQTLDLGISYLSWDTDWYGLTSLTSLSCEASLEDLEKCMDVSQLTVLNLSCDFLMSDCSGLEAYSQLEYLKLDCGGHGMELTGISRAASLQTLIIEHGDYIAYFGELYDMPWLKELSIDSEGLEDIGFIREMDDLERLELADTKLSRIDAIADCADTLKCLRLHRNYSVKDYSPVFGCTGLEELELYVNYDREADMTMPDLSMMPGLKALTLGNYEKFDGLENLTALESLTLADTGSFGGDGELKGLENLTKLKTLSFLSVSMEPKLLESFAGLESLETIDLKDSFIWGDLNAVFGMPNLKALHLENADFGLRLDGMPVSESLLELDMTGAHVHQLKEDGSWDYGAGNTQINLGDCPEFFSHMPNLIILKVPKQELRDVKFAAELSRLTYLDITYNGVTDLSPLAGLEQLKVIICENNPVNDRTGLKNVIVIE